MKYTLWHTAAAVIASFGFASTSLTAADAPTDEPQQVVLEVKGMSCASCASSISTALKKVDGVKEASVDVKGGTATIQCEAGKADPSALTAAVEKAGYTASVKQ